MGRKTAKMLGLVLAGSMVISMTSPVADAAAKMSLSKKKITITQGEKVTLKVKKATKKVKWSVTKGKKVIKLSKKKKASVVITGKKAGKAVVTAKAGKKKLTCKVKVKAANTDVQPTQAPATQAPATNKPASSPVTTAPTVSETPVVSEAPTTAPSESPKANEPVKNIVIDMSKVSAKTFTSSPAALDFSSQIESRFDLSYFKEVKVGYTLEINEEADIATITGGKIAVASTTDDLDGYSDGIAFSYNLSSTDETSTTIDLSGDKVSGSAVGLNVQPMDSANNYGWPAALKSITITSIEFVAKEGAVYTEGGVKPTPESTVAPEFESSEFHYDGLDQAWIDANIDPSKPVVAISFDDGPGGYSKFVDYGMQIQNSLKEYGAHATFFYIGAHIKHDEDSRNEVISAKEAGFEVANHSYDSNGLNKEDADIIKEKIQKTDALLKELTGYNNFLFRAPNVAYSDTMFAVIEKPFIDVSVWSNDYVNSTTKEDLVENVTKNLKDGDIINMHSVHEKTAQAVPEILKYCKDNGIQVVGVSELFAIKRKALMTGQKYNNAY
ncbi:MAG: polysaccharide deacetylase family protein [Roseburia sp.]|nr:polysaccharide deacetylase family protein [Roseburia sp.]